MKWHPESSICLLMLLWAVCAAGAAQGQTDIASAIRAREIGPTAFGGRIVDIETAADNPFHIFVASASGGLWMTENNGTTWQCIFDREGTVSIGDIAVDPRDPTIIWVGTGEANNQRSSLWGDGVYKSTDGGKSWKHAGLSDTHHIGRIVIDPQDSNVVYVAAAGHLYSFNDERGVFKTVDGGETWERILFVSPQTGFIDLVMDPTNPQTLFAASYQRLRRAWHLEESGRESAIYRSRDGGATWQLLSGGLPSGNIGRIGLTIFPQNPQIVYATVANFNPATGGGGTEAPADEDENEADDRESLDHVAESVGNESVLEMEGVLPDQDQDSHDDQDSVSAHEAQGKSVVTPFGFELADNGEAVVIRNVNRDLAPNGVRNRMRVKSWAGIDAANREALLQAASQTLATDQVIMIVQSGDAEQSIVVRRRESAAAPAAPRIVGGEIYRSDDGGDTWTKTNRTPVGGQPPYYYGQIRVDPQDANRLYVLSVPVHVSTDGGRTWRADGARSVHVDHHAMWINPQDGRHMLLGNDGGFHISYDRGGTWDHVANLPLAQFYAIGVDMQRPYHVYGGTQDNGTWGGPSRGVRGTVNSNEWYRVGGGDGFYVQVDPTDHNYIIAESQFGAIFRLHRASGRTQSIRPRQSEPNGPRDRFNWNSPILLSHHDPRIVYFGGNKLFKSMNRGDDWEVISPDLTTAHPERIRGNVPYCTITTIAESPLDRNQLLVGTDDGNLQWSRDGGANWVNMVERLPFRPAEWWCSRVVLSHHDAKVAYATFTGYREDDFRPFVFKTIDGGESWTSIANGLPAAPVNVLCEDARNANLLFIGTDFGVFLSLDAGQHWTEMKEGLTRASVHDMVIHRRDRDLVVGTHGRGIFIFDDISPLQQWDATVWETPVTLFEPRTAVIYQSGLREIADLSGNRRFTAENPPAGARVWYYVSADLARDLKLQLTIQDLKGNTIESVELPNKPGLNAHTVSIIGEGGGARGGRGGGAQNRPQGLRPGTYLIELTTADGVQRVPLVVESVNP